MALTPEERQAILDALGTNEETSDAPKIASGAPDPTQKYYLVWDAEKNDFVKKENPLYDEALDNWKRALLQRQASGIGAVSPRTAAQEAQDAAQADYYGAQAAKARRDMENPFLLKQQQIEELIGTIRNQFERGEITSQQANEMMTVARQNLDASLRGTTPWQMEDDRKKREEDARNNRLTLAEKLLQSQGQMGGSLATGLLNSLTGGYGKIIGSAFQGGIINPLEMTRAYMNEFGAGPELNDLAKGLLSGYLRQQPPQQPQGGI